jgi:O-methyltransferase domain/Dimerisation domain
MTTTTTSPPAALLQMMTGYWVSQAIYVAAKLGIADRLGDGPVSCEALAAATDSHGPSIYRVMRALASVGIFSETAPRYFGLTPLAALLRSGMPDSMRFLAIAYSEELYRAWEDMLHSAQTGEPAFEHRFGMPVFEYYAHHPESDRVLNQALTQYTNQLANAVVATYDFSSFGTVVDVGGGYGTLLATILQSNPDARGVLFDQPHVVAGAEELLTAAGVVDRCSRVAGDFFAAVPSAGDAYVLAQVLHDWDDARSLAILAQCRRAMSSHSRLLVVELVLPAGNEPFFGKWLDLHMLAITGGLERTQAEYEKLFRSAGFALSRVIPTPAGPSVVEAVPVFTDGIPTDTPGV